MSKAEIFIGALLLSMPWGIGAGLTMVIYDLIVLDRPLSQCGTYPGEFMPGRLILAIIGGVAFVKLLMHVIRRA
jgi:hypothetical protein